jgi:hypothetical protein
MQTVRRQISPREEARMGVRRGEDNSLELPAIATRRGFPIASVELHSEYDHLSVSIGRIPVAEISGEGFGSRPVSMFLTKNRRLVENLFVIGSDDALPRQVILGATSLSHEVGVFSENVMGHFAGKVMRMSDRRSNFAVSVEVNHLLEDIRTITVTLPTLTTSTEPEETVSFVLKRWNPGLVMRGTFGLTRGGDPVLEPRSFIYVGDVPLRRE